MTKFITLFKQMWLQKLKYVYLAFIINIFLIIFISAFATFSHDYDLNFFYSPEKNLNSFWASNFATITLYVDLAFFALTCWEDEKINLSQTWHLIPTNEKKLFTANIISSLASCGLLFLMQQIVNTLLFLPSRGAKSLSFVFSSFSLWMNKYNTLSSTLLHWLFIILIIVFLYLFVSFANFSSRIISETLPVKSTLWIRLFLIALLVIIAVYSGSIILSHVDGIINRVNILRNYDPIWLDDLLVFIVSFILGIFDLWFIDKYIEPKINNR